jgi:hypothetical protein
MTNINGVEWPIVCGPEQCIICPSDAFCRPKPRLITPVEDQAAWDDIRDMRELVRLRGVRCD